MIDLKNIVRDHVLTWDKVPEEYADIITDKTLSIIKKNKDYPVSSAVIIRYASKYIDGTLDRITPIAETVLPVINAQSNDLQNELEQVKLQLKGYQLQDTWEGVKLALLSPMYKDTNPGTCWSMMAIMRDYGTKVWWEPRLGDAMIYHSRSALAHKFIEGTQAEWSLWLDDDMVIPMGRPEQFRSICSLQSAQFPDSLAGINTVARLLGSGQKIIGAAYFQRSPNGLPVFHEGTQNREYFEATKNYDGTPRPITWCGTGCLLVHRDVYTAIRDDTANEHLKPDMPYREHFDYFRPEGNDGEDVSFCKRAARVGFQPYIDTGIPVMHIGRACYHAFNTRML